MSSPARAANLHREVHWRGAGPGAPGKRATSGWNNDWMVSNNSLFSGSRLDGLDPGGGPVPRTLAAGTRPSSFLDPGKILSLLGDEVRDGARLVAPPVSLRFGGAQSRADVQGPAHDPN
jgi:hypothetical protein